MATRFRVASLCVIGAATTTASAQVVGISVQLVPSPGPNLWYAETVIAANPLNPSEILVASRERFVEGSTSLSQIVYGISTHGLYPTFSSPTGAYGTLLIPSSGSCQMLQSGFDPMIAWSRRTGDMWLGAQRNAASGTYAGGFHVARRAAGATVFDPSRTIICDLAASSWDKPLMAMGPAFGQAPNAPETMYVVMRFDGFCGQGVPQMLYAESDYSTSPPTVPGE